MIYNRHKVSMEMVSIIRIKKTVQKMYKKIKTADIKVSIKVSIGKYY